MTSPGHYLPRTYARAADATVCAPRPSCSSPSWDRVSRSPGVALDQVRPGDSFAFRVHKRGTHGYVDPTLALESDLGGQFADALEQREGTPPGVDLTDPDVPVNAEVLGTTRLVGVVQRAWQPRPAGTASEAH